MRDADIERALLWFASRLPPEGSLPSFQMQVFGPPITVGYEENVAEFHTYALLYPERAIYAGYRTDSNSYPHVSPQEIRQIIQEFVPTQEYVDRQREVARLYTPGHSTLERWDLALTSAEMLELPLAVMGFGHIQGRTDVVAALHTVAWAPLRRTVEAFKKAAPLLGMN